MMSPHTPSDVTMVSLITRRRRTVLAVTGTLTVLYLLYSILGNQQLQRGPSIYPSIRFVAANRQQASKKGIPRIIHQTWKTSAVPQPLVEWVLSWRRNHPDWEYWFWTDDDLQRLIHTSFPHYRSLFNGYPENGYRADVFRYLVLYMHGGVYADLDMESLHPLDDIIDKYACLLSQEPEEHAHFLAPLGIPLVSNALMACRPKHPFFQEVIYQLSSHAGWFGWTDILHATGPYMLTMEYQRYHKDGSSTPTDLYLAPPDLFQPLVDRSMLDIMRSNCLPGHGQQHYFLSEEFITIRQRLCRMIQGRTLLDKPPVSALTVHHFTHLWAGRMYDPWGVFNSRENVTVEELLSRKIKAGHPAIL